MGLLQNRPDCSKFSFKELPGRKLPTASEPRRLACSLLPVLLHSYRVFVSYPHCSTRLYLPACERCVSDSFTASSDFSTLERTFASRDCPLDSFRSCLSLLANFPRGFRLSSCSAGAAFPLSFPPAVGHKRRLTSTKPDCNISCGISSGHTRKSM